MKPVYKLLILILIGASAVYIGVFLFGEEEGEPPYLSLILRLKNRTAFLRNLKNRTFRRGTDWRYI